MDGNELPAAELGADGAELTFVASAQDALAWLLQDEPTEARKVLDGLDPQQLDRIRTAALELAALVDELELHRVVGARHLEYAFANRSAT